MDGTSFIFSYLGSFFRLCGRIFCYYCSNNFVMTKHSGKKERCCRDCYTQHSAVVERFTEVELSPSDSEPPPTGAGPQPHPEPAPYKPIPRVTGERQAHLAQKFIAVVLWPSVFVYCKLTEKQKWKKWVCHIEEHASSFKLIHLFPLVSDPSNRSDDGAFDIITEEEVNGVYDSDTNSQTTGGSLDGEQDRRPPGALDMWVWSLPEDRAQGWGWDLVQPVIFWLSMCLCALVRFPQLKVRQSQHKIPQLSSWNDSFKDITSTSRPTQSIIALRRVTTAYDTFMNCTGLMMATQKHATSQK